MLCTCSDHVCTCISLCTCMCSSRVLQWQIRLHPCPYHLLYPSLIIFDTRALNRAAVSGQSICFSMGLRYTYTVLHVQRLMVACADIITAHAETNGCMCRHNCTETACADMITACADMITACAETNGCMCRHDHCIRQIIACACYVGIFTPGHSYVYADIVIETHGAPYYLYRFSQSSRHNNYVIVVTHARVPHGIYWLSSDLGARAAGLEGKGTTEPIYPCAHK